ncbi:MAG: RNA methyltransferase [Deltaproteobacteria bacterium]|nr:RNA methyltransferase [Deltaproteobacteria bacterium]
MRQGHGGEKEKLFENVSIVLVEPMGAGNVGSAARAMKNTGFSSLVLVNPCGYRNNEGFSMACKAHEVLLNAREFPDLTSAVKDSPVVIGTTRRLGRTRYPVLTLQEAVPKIVELAGKNRVSILFGREDKGLKNTEIPLCDILLEIPLPEGYRSINLSHAVFTVCYHLFTASGQPGTTIKAVPKEEAERMYLHMEGALRALGYGEEGGEYLLNTILRSFRRLFGRTALMQKEVNMLRGIFTQIEERAAKRQHGGT